jgi:seryl-tRNA synthetase
MIDLKVLRETPEFVANNLKARNLSLELSEIIDLDKEIVLKVKENEKKQNQRNIATQRIAKKEVMKEEKEKLILQTRQLAQNIKENSESIKQLEEKRKEQLSWIPNFLQKEVPLGKDELANKQIKKAGEQKEFAFSPKPHYELGEKLGILDIARGVKMSRSRFSLLKGAGAMLDRALAQFMLDIHKEQHGYQEWQTPFLVHPSSLFHTGQLPKFHEDLFQTTDGLYLIPTAEVSLTNIYRDEVLKESELPLQLTAYTPCFRREAGSYGKDTKGLIRQHQFSKVELVWITHPEQSEEAHQKLLLHAETILERLELPYRTMLLCSGDTGFSASKCYDIEVWLPSENTYREISSCSNCLDFQARRANIKYQSASKKRFVHTLNGSGLAIGRTWIAILENYQREDGSIKIPKALHNYTNGLTILK